MIEDFSPNGILANPPRSLAILSLAATVLPAILARGGGT
jgi:hypothetical protein